jgi:hypothetical protein
MTKPIGIQFPEVIDLATHDPKSDEFVLIMFEARTWDGSEERLGQLQKKVNNYLFFAMGGQIEKHYPHALDKPIRFQLDCHHEPDPKSKYFIDSIKTTLEKEGIKFVVNKL